MTDIAHALREMFDSELRIGAVLMTRYAAAEAAAGKPRAAGLWHAVALAVAEEQDRRRDILAALDPDLEDDTAGEIVGGVG